MSGVVMLGIVPLSSISNAWRTIHGKADAVRAHMQLLWHSKNVCVWDVGRAGRPALELGTLRTAAPGFEAKTHHDPPVLMDKVLEPGDLSEVRVTRALDESNY